MSKRLIKNFVFTPGVGLDDNLFPDAYNLLTRNRTFIEAEIAAFLNNQVADTVKCERDIGYIIDGAGFDITLGTNYNATFLGIAEDNSQDLGGTVFRTIERTKTEVLALPAVLSDATATQRATAYFDEILNIAQNGRNVASPRFFNNPVGATTSLIAVKDRLLSNLNFIVAEINAWVAVTYPNADHDPVKCSRDVIYAVYGLIYDMLYGGNSATYDSAKFFFYGFADGSPGIDPTHRLQTAAAYNRLQEIVGPIALGVGVARSVGNNLIQDQTGNNATSLDAARLQGLVQIIEDVVGAVNQAAALSALAAYIRTTPDVSWSTTALKAAKTAIDAAKNAIFYNVLAFKDYVFDVAKCARDRNYVLDALFSDFRYGGNEQIIYVSSKYWEGAVPQIDGNRLAEIETYLFAQELITDYIFLNLADSIPEQTGISQVVDFTKTAEAGASESIETIVEILTSVIAEGLSALPEEDVQLANIETIGKIDLEDLLLISNVTSNEIMYNFSDPTKGGTIEFFEENTTNYPNAITVNNGVTKIRFKTNCANMASSDSIQVFIEAKETKVRPYDFGTDAIERMRVAQPQAMLDADFEYGLQPTKWQALGQQRGYPSAYELNASDIPVVDVTTDASVSTENVGASLITVTTFNDHGLSAGSPFTIRALSVSVLGFARAEGTFVIEEITSPSTFTYYAKAKVGSFDGQVLASSNTQLRAAGFYTGASVGEPTISVFSNGSNGTFDTAVRTPSGGTSLTFIGDAPPTGAPITGTGIAAGAQVSGVFGSNNVDGKVAVRYVRTTVGSGSGSVQLSNVSDIVAGMSIDDQGVTPNILVISSIAGNTLNLAGLTAAALRGDENTFIGAATSIVGSGIDGTIDVVISSGTGALLDVTISGGTASAVINSGGSNYAVNNTLRVLGSDIGGVSPGNDLIFTVATVSSGSITSVSFTSGTVPTYGVNATLDVTISEGLVTAVPNNGGSGYQVGNLLFVAGDLIGGTAPDNNITFRVTAVSSGVISSVVYESGTAPADGGPFNNVTTTVISGPWLSRSTTNISTFGNLVSVTVNAPGTGYAVGDTIRAVGNFIGGTTPTNDLYFTVASISGGGLATLTYVDGIVGPNANTYSGVAITNVASRGTGATFTVQRAAGAYTVTASGTMTKYAVGNRFTVSGVNFEGTSPTNDCTITISTISGVGSILTAAGAGTVVRGDQIDIWATVAISIPTTLAVSAGSTISYTAISTIEVNWPNPHGFVPGMGLNIVVNSAGVNHELAAGPYFVETIPTLTSIRYTARAPGTIDTSTAIEGIIYARPDTFFSHRPFDGGVQLGTGGPQHGAGAVRQSKKYIRYQSGKGAMYNTGALFCPSFDLRSATATSTASGSPITFATDDTDHGLQAGSVVVVSGVLTTGYNGEYTVSEIVDERTFRVFSTTQLGATTAVIGSPCQIALKNWHGAVVRSGPFDDQNGIFFQYNGRELAVGRRSATTQLAGNIAINADSNAVIGTDTRFRDQLQSGDRIVIRGMTHVVSHIQDNTTMYVTPDFRGVRNVSGVKIAKVQDIIVPQSDWNLDTCDGNGPSGYKIDVTKMQMIGIQFSWYGAGAIDWMFRGSNGDYVFCHRLKGNNLNTEAYMRTGNLPVRYEVLNESAKSRLASDINASVTTLTLENTFDFPDEGGVVYIDNEIISFTGKDDRTKQLTGCSRGTSLVNFSAGATRTFSAAAATSHTSRTGVVLISNTTSPIISHWGSAYLIDGNFDSDRGYIFNYAATGVSATLDKKTAFLIRLAPSVSNAVTGDLGERELLNRAQLLLQAISVTSDAMTSGASAVVVEGVLNPGNYPANPSNITWGGLSSPAAGGQPSFAQIALGGSVTWVGDAPTTTTATVSAAVTTSVAAVSVNLLSRNITAVSFDNSVSQTYNRALSSTRNDFLMTTTQFDATDPPLGIGDRLAASSFLTSGQTISSITRSFIDLGGTNYTRIVMSANANSSSSLGAGNNVTIAATLAASITYNRAFATNRNDFIITNASAVSSNIELGDRLATSSFITGGQVINAITPSFITIAGTTYTRIIMSANANNSSTQGAGTVAVTVTANGTAASYTNTNFLFFTQATWEASGATLNTRISTTYTKFPAGTSIVGIAPRILGTTTVYRVTFNQTSSGTIAPADSPQPTFQFGASQFAAPGETVFSFVSNPGETSTLELDQLKELTTTAIGGRGTFPNGPDVLAINVYKISGTPVNTNIILRWGEAQA
jgi:hypothetical protein